MFIWPHMYIPCLACGPLYASGATASFYYVWLPFDTSTRAIHGMNWVIRSNMHEWYSTYGDICIFCLGRSVELDVYSL